MRKVLLNLGVICFVLSFALTASAQKEGVRFYEVNGDPPIIDGDMSEMG